MQTSQTATDLIKTYEGFRPEPYYCAGGVLSIGYGTARNYRDGHPIQLGDEIDEFSAELELVCHIREQVEPALDRIFPDAGLSFPQRDALASFVYNMGGGNPKRYETLVRLVNERAPDHEICDQLVKYRLAGGKRQLGLYRRRLAECCVWLDRPFEQAQYADWSTNWRDLTGYVQPVPVIAEPEPEPEPEPVSKPEPVPKRQRFRGRPRRTIKAEQPQPEQPAEPRRAPISRRTRQPHEVPYRIQRDAGLKPLEESKRAMGYVYQQVGTGIVRVGAGLGLGGFGFVAQDPVLSTTVVTLFVVSAVFVTGWVLREYGDWKRQRGEFEAQQGLY